MFPDQHAFVHGGRADQVRTFIRYFPVKMIDERRGKGLSAARLLVFPFFIAMSDLTERGQVLYRRFLISYGLR